MSPSLALVKALDRPLPEPAEPSWQPRDPRQPLGPFSIGQLEEAINRARKQLTRPEPGAGLPADVTHLAGLYGWMIFHRLDELSPDRLNRDELDALIRWI